jgi:site-specific DNA-methyltransferase (adenine-specific)
MQTRHKIIIADSRAMPELSDESVHLVVTSPPYWQLKDYSSDNQIGYNDSYEDYINNLNLVWSECYRALHKGCRLCVNVGDQFARSVYYGRYKVIPIRTEITRFCETIGFDYMGAIIWQKVTTCNTTGGATIMGSFPYPRNGIVKIDYEFILLFKKGGAAPKPTAEARQLSRLTTEEWNGYFNGHWTFPGERQQNHLAMFPEELPKRLIRMFSFAGETVLDPFIGSGTTALAAMNQGRNSIGYEISAQFIPVIRERLGMTQAGLFTGAKVEFLDPAGRQIDIEQRRKALPYLFRDPVAIERKVDPKGMSFGSRIDSKSQPASNGQYVVRAIVSPEIIALDSGQKVRLIGIRTEASSQHLAMRYLEDKVKGQKVFLRFDDVKFDGDGNLLCYVYLRNKTFVNAHLARTGFVGVDGAGDYRLKKKLLSESEKAEWQKSGSSTKR